MIGLAQVARKSAPVARSPADRAALVQSRPTPGCADPVLLLPSAHSRRGRSPTACVTPLAPRWPGRTGLAGALTRVTFLPLSAITLVGQHPVRSWVNSQAEA